MKKGLLLIVCVFYFIGMGASQDKTKNDTITTKSGLKYFKVKKGTGTKVEKNNKIFTHVILTDLKGTDLPLFYIQPLLMEKEELVNVFLQIQVLFLILR